MRMLLTDLEPMEYFEVMTELEMGEDFFEFELEDDEDNLEADLEAWNDMQEAYRRARESDDPMDWDIYSDLYKDYYGVRPRYC